MFRIEDLGLRVEGSTSERMVSEDIAPVTWVRVSSFEFRLSRFGFWVLVFRFRVSGSGFRVSGFRFQVPGSGFRVSGFGFRASGFGLRVLGARVRTGEEEGEQGVAEVLPRSTCSFLEAALLLPRLRHRLQGLLEIKDTHRRRGLR